MKAPVLTTEALAHLSEDGRPHLLVDHLSAVGDAAAQFARNFDSSEWARLAGLWHDLGKFAGNFQRMIREENGFEAHLEGNTDGPRDHSTAGAIHAFDRLGTDAIPIAFAIAEHHAGLGSREELRRRILEKRERIDAVRARNPPGEILDPFEDVPKLAEDRGALHLEMWTRMLFSTLCDADFLDTEAFYDASAAALRGSAISISTLRARLHNHLHSLEQAAPNTLVNQIRCRSHRM